VTAKSGTLLAAACVAVIAAVGSIFELAYGDPDLGATATGAILAVTAPLGGALLWAAIRAGRAPSE